MRSFNEIKNDYKKLEAFADEIAGFDIDRRKDKKEEFENYMTKAREIAETALNLNKELDSLSLEAREKKSDKNLKKKVEHKREELSLFYKDNENKIHLTPAGYMSREFDTAAAFSSYCNEKCEDIMFDILTIKNLTITSMYSSLTSESAKKALTKSIVGWTSFKDEVTCSFNSEITFDKLLNIVFDTQDYLKLEACLTATLNNEDSPTSMPQKLSGVKNESDWFLANSAKHIVEREKFDKNNKELES